MIYLESLCIEAQRDLDVLEEALFKRDTRDRGISLRRLKKLVVSIGADNSLKAADKSLQNILGNCADTLEELVVLPSPHAFFKTFDEPLDLTKLKSLKHFNAFLELSNYGLSDDFYDTIPCYMVESDDILSSLDTLPNLLIGGRFPMLRILNLYISFISDFRIIEDLKYSAFASRLQSKSGFTLQIQKLDQERSPLLLFASNPSWTRIKYRPQPS
ncbi:hypothetical protein CPB83DRAFT_884696 [Crepidotus variabilis]|uniref:Uncharacterized protein n=1 Tax=Crepidotus variabilis TaxID=179855 RepID=A0A9P6JNE4_9AGAR|nr:hypothetical protein CPB83DRAFT_884696 [Crepidotus variabilis]